MLQRTTVWQLHHREQPVTECEAWKDNDTVHVVVTRSGGDDVEQHTFADTADAVRWASVFQGRLLADGWMKVI